MREEAMIGDPAAISDYDSPRRIARAS